MLKMAARFILCCYFVLQWRYTFCYTHHDMTRLLEDLLNETRYSKSIRPIKNQDKVIEVNITPGIMSIESLDVNTGELQSISYIQLSWFDEFLVWDPANYGGITKLSLPYDKLWTPSLSQSHGALKGNTGHVINPGFAPVTVLANGSALLVTTGYFVTKCYIDTRFYPFDEHFCSFIFFPALHDTTEMELNSHLSDIALELFQKSYVWYYTKTEYKKSASTVESIAFSLSVVEFSIYLKRRPTFELINSFIPILLLTVLNIATNFVPAGSGERLSFAITLYLSFIFITSAQVDEMPHVSVNIAITSYIMLSFNVLNTASVLWSVLIVRMSGWKTCNTPIPTALHKLSSWCDNRNAKREIKKYPIKSCFESQHNGNHLDKETADKEENESYVEVRDESDSLTWAEVAESLDKLYSIIITILITVVILIIFCLWMLS